MIPPALQQDSRFTDALLRMGRKAGSIQIDGHDVQYIDNGPIRYFARPERRIAPQLLRRRCFTVVNTQTISGMHGSGFYRLMTGQSIAALNLTQTFRPYQKWRNSLNRAQAMHTFTTHRPFQRSDEWVLEKDLRQQKDKKYRAMSHDVIRHWPRRDTILSMAWDGKQPIAAMLTLLHGKAATYQVGWSGAVGRARNAHHLLLAQLTARLQSMGVHSLELGGIDTHHAAGLARFKIGTGADIIPLGGTWGAFR